jgi:hypothetical protein
MAAPVGQQNLLTDADPPHRRAVPPLGTVEDELSAHRRPGQPICRHEEQRGRHDGITGLLAQERVAQLAEQSL